MKVGFKQEHFLFKKQQSTSDVGQHRIRNKAKLSVGSSELLGISRGIMRLCISPDFGGIALFCSTCGSVRPKVPLFSMESENIVLSCTVTCQEVLHDWRMLLWGYWEASTHVKQMLCHVNNSSSVWERGGCCKWEAWVGLVEAAHAATAAPLTQDNLFDWLTIQMESWIRPWDGISAQVCTTDFAESSANTTQAVTVPLYRFSRTLTIPAWTFNSLLVQGVTLEEMFCSSDRKAFSADWGLNSVAQIQHKYGLKGNPRSWGTKCYIILNIIWVTWSI